MLTGEDNGLGTNRNEKQNNQNPTQNPTRNNIEDNNVENGQGIHTSSLHYFLTWLIFLFTFFRFLFIYYLNFIGGSSDGVEVDRRYDFSYQLFCTEVLSTSTIL